MTSPRVIELPRRLEPVERDTFLAAVRVGAGRAAGRAGKVVALRPRAAVDPRRPDSRPPLAA
ncbi:MAG TPA: hypothetical protein VG474_10115 [Solirubrobacteraceae bacterium]|nr:hypothetical protein [Solirubrobacteraceae bacterium]